MIDKEIVKNVIEFYRIILLQYLIIYILKNDSCLYNTNNRNTYKK